MAENSKLKEELDLLADQKIQKNLLTEKIHQILAESNSSERALSTRVNILENLLKTNSIEFEIQPIPEPAPLETLNAKNVELSITLQSLNLQLNQLKSHNSTLLVDLETVRSLLEAEKERKSEIPVTVNNAAAAAKTWWKGASAPNTSNTATTSADTNVSSVNSSQAASKPSWWSGKSSSSAVVVEHGSAMSVSSSEDTEKLQNTLKAQTLLLDQTKLLLDDLKAKEKLNSDQIEKLTADNAALKQSLIEEHTKAPMKVEEFNGKLKVAETLIEALKSEITAKEKELEEKKILDDTIKLLEQESKNAIEQKENLDSVIVSLNLKLTELEMQLETNKEENSILTKRLALLEQSMVCNPETSVLEQGENKDLANILSTTQNRLNVSQQEIRVLEESLSKEKQNNQKLQMKNSELIQSEKKEISDHLKTICVLRENVKKLDLDNSTLLKELKSLKEQLGTHETEFEKQKAELQHDKEVLKQEKDATVKQLLSDKEKSDIAMKGLQDQMSQLQADSATKEKIIKQEADDKLKKEKSELEERYKKERIEIDERSKKEKYELDEKIKKEKLDSEERNKREKHEIEEKNKKERVEMEERSKKEKYELDEKSKKDKLEMELRFKKEKSELEEKYKKESARFQAEIDKLKKELETQKSSKQEEAIKINLKLKTVEQDLQNNKTEYTKATEALNIKIGELQKQLAENQLAAKEGKLLCDEHDKFKAEFESLQSKHEVLTQELEVSRLAFDRSSKLMLEKEDLNKKLRLKNDELLQLKDSLKNKIISIEKDNDEFNISLKTLSADLESAQRNLTESKSKEEEAVKSYTNKLSELEAELQLAKSSRGVAETKAADLEKELKINERKSAQIVNKTNSRLKTCKSS
jgi:hypothetical protein